jgi:hypothetical protein
MKPTKKFVGRERETAEEKGKKHHPEARLRRRDDLGVREDDLDGGRQNPLLPSLCHIQIYESGSGLAHSLFLHELLHHLLAMCDALDGHAMAGHLELKESASARKKKTWRPRRSKGLVNSKIKGFSLK